MLEQVVNQEEYIMILGQVLQALKKKPSVRTFRDYLHYQTAAEEIWKLLTDTRDEQNKRMVDKWSADLQQLNQWPIILQSPYVSIT